MKSAVALVVMVIGASFCSTAATPPLVYSLENTGTNYPAPPLPTFANCPFIQPLPDPFAWATNSSGVGRSTNFTDWEYHRNEIRAQIENYEIGTKPPIDIPSQVFASYSGGTGPGGSGTLTVRVTNYVSSVARTLTLTCAVRIPTNAIAPYPVNIGMDSPYGSLPANEFTNRGIAGITYSESQVTTYNNPQSTDAYYKLYPSLWGNSGQYSAWAWGVSRVIDGLTMLTNTLPMDLTHISVTGCSYAGKLALYSGAFDERIALTLAQESGGGGDTSWRYSATEASGTVEGIAQTSGQWFRTSLISQFGGANGSYLPEDHHMLMAMCAPRALYCTANTGYTWLSNPSAYVCGRACGLIYQTLGIADRFGFNVDGNHTHCAYPSDQLNDLRYFLNKFMKGTNSLSQTIRTVPSDYSSIDYARWTAWWGTTNPVFPYLGTLTLNIPSSANENDGVLTGQGSVTMTPAPYIDPLTITLSSSLTNKVTVPPSVTFALGQSNAVFDITIIDNAFLDGDQTSTIKATNTYAINGPQSKTITVHDNETTTLSVSLPASASETAGATPSGTASMAAPAGANVSVKLTASDPTLIQVGTVVIPSGATSVVIHPYVVDKGIVGGSQNVTVTAHVANWSDGSNSMTIVFDDPVPSGAHFTLSTVPSPQIIGESFPLTITAQDSGNNTLDYRLPATLSALIPGSAPGTNMLLNSPSAEQSSSSIDEREFGYTFTPSTTLKVTHVRSYFGDRVSIWNANGQLLASQNVAGAPGTWVDTPLPMPLVLVPHVTYLITAHETGAQYFWSQSLPTTFANGTLTQSWWDWGDGFPTQNDGAQWYLVDLKYATDFFTAPVTPGTTANFSNGIWTGSVAAPQPATNMLLQASTDPSHTGLGNPFTVLGTPKLGIAGLGQSVVLYWPTGATGLNLQQATTLSDWTNLPVTPSTVVDRYTVTNSVGNGPAFFRLVKP